MIYDSDSVAILKASNWLSIIGNRVQNIVYTGIEANNPSGNTKNIKKQIFYNGYNEIVYAINYDYNSQDIVINMYSTAN